MAASGRILQAYHADLQDFLRATGYLPKNRSPVALGKMRKIPIISWVAAGRWTETGETFIEEDVIEWIETDVHPCPPNKQSWSFITGFFYFDEGDRTKGVLIDFDRMFM